MRITGKIIDIHKREIYPGAVIFDNGIIVKIQKLKEAPEQYIMPGLIDAHIHIESSMVTPGSFAKAAVSRGTTAVVSDPHEIANVLGRSGVQFMIDDSKRTPMKFYFGAPSCVPATSFEKSGDTLDSADIRDLMKSGDIYFLSEMMNFPGVIYDDKNVIEKISIAKREGKPVDGHAPGLSGESLRKYISAGITTDHECSTYEEAKEKIAFGMKIIIREGSAARNLDALKDLLKSDPEMVMLCSDDLHPEMLVRGHINRLVARLISEGYDLFDVIKSCTLNPAMHYNLNAGLLQAGQPADFIVVDDYRLMNVTETWIDGQMVFGGGKVLFDYNGAIAVNKFNSSFIKNCDITVPAYDKEIRIIQAFDHELLTKQISAKLSSEGFLQTDTVKDILKIIVKDRYTDSAPAIGFINGFGLKSGAFASSVAHDSHNIICVGVNDEEIVSAVNEIVRMKGGLSVSNKGTLKSLPLNIAGIMSDQSCETIAAQYEELSNQVRSMGCLLSAPFMTLSFMALLVIPELKISDSGLFDGVNFSHVPLYR